MAVAAHSSLWDSVLHLTKTAQDRNLDPLLWAIQLSSALKSSGVALPSTDLAHLLVSHICWENNVPAMWKFLDKALTLNIAPPMLLLALLSTRVIPNRRNQPTAYRLYLELLRRYTFSPSQINGPNYHKILRSIDDVLHLSQIFGLQGCEPGLLLVEFVFSLVWQLLDASLDDEGLLDLTAEKNSRWLVKSQDMDIDGHGSYGEKRTESLELIQRANTTMAIEIIGEFLQNNATSRILCLACLNMPSHWGYLIQRLQLLVASSAALRNSKIMTPEALLQLTSHTCKILSCKSKNMTQEKFCAVMAPEPLIFSAGQCNGATQSSLWLPIDMFLEDIMDGSQVAATGAVEILTGLVKALHTVNGLTWHETFLGLWIASLRLVQRERTPSEGPKPHLDTRMTILVSITTLTVANIIEEEEGELIDETEHGPSSKRKDNQVQGERRKDLITSLQLLGDYESLLTPPQSACLAANQAAMKALLFISGITVSSGYYDCVSANDMPMNFSGNLRHLIVESCIARNILDTSAYFWPGYVSGRNNQMPRSVTSQMPSWSSFMKGSPLTSALVNALVATPASSLAEIEKVYETAINGSNDEKISAATILCGASLVRGWNIQEHSIFFIIGLLSPPVPGDCSGSVSHLISLAPLLNILLVGISSLDCVHIFSLHGAVPHLAGALMPICEVFGSQVPSISWTLPTGEDISCHEVFSNAFTLLLRLWRFTHPPLEHLKGEVAPVGSQLSPEYLLLIRNSQVASFGKSRKDQITSKRLSKHLRLPVDPILMDSFPKLKHWHRQHLECISSTLSGLINGNPVHNIVDALLNMMFRKINKGSHLSASVNSSSSNSTASGSEDTTGRLKVPAWDILEATPYVLDAALTACAHEKLSSRDLVTGLKDLADFLPATLGTIISYFSAEVTRGIWKPASMNGTDWPSPANLSTVEQQIKKILAATGVDVPSHGAVGGSYPDILPLPLAALVSLTITYRLDKASERFLNLAGPALNSLAASCPWPCFPIIASLWSQKVKRWSDYLVFSASRTVFHHNKDAVVQLLKSCFTSALGHSPYDIATHGGVGGVGAILGHGFGSHFSGGISPVAPGIFYLRVHRSVRDVMFITEEILSLLMLSVSDIASSGLPKEKLEIVKKTKYGMRNGRVSLATAMARVKLAASLGASLVWVTGGSGLVHNLIRETLPSWFISAHSLRPHGGDSDGKVAMLCGYALAYFSVLCGTLAWGPDSASPASKRRPKVLRDHLEFLANAMDGNVSLGCPCATWHAYVSGFVSLVVNCVPTWVLGVDVNLLKRLSDGLRHYREQDLALALLAAGGTEAMGAAAELIIQNASQL